MASFAVEILSGVVLVLGIYILFGQQYLGGSSSSGDAKAGSKKKKRSKAKKGTSSADVVQDGGKPAVAVPSVAQQMSTTTGRDAKGSKDSKPSQQVNGAQAQPTSKQNKTNGQTARRDAEQEDDFPSLQQSYAAKAGPGSQAGKSNGEAQRKTLAERKAKPQAKTAVDDMIDEDDPYQKPKTFSQTMRIVKPADEVPTVLDEEVPSDYSDEESAWTGAARTEKEPAWQSVPVSSKKPGVLRISSSASKSAAPVAASRSVPGLTEMSKKQRQNARKAAEAKAIKEAEEQDRLQRLAAHRRQLERERMNEQNKQKPRQPVSQPGRSNRETVGGGMQASVHNGQLIWE